MADVLYSNESYCAICDLYFLSINDRAEHIRNSSRHPRCDTCDRRFLNKNTLRNHFTYSRYHHYCASCRISFETAAGLRMHIEYASVHRDDSDDEDAAPVGFVEGQKDTVGRIKFPDEDGAKDDDDDDDQDNSWEHYDECDFEDEEDLGDRVLNDTPYVSPIGQNEVGEDEAETLIPTHKFACPVCKLPPVTTCSTPCGHLFCFACIRQAYQQHGACPICEGRGSIQQLRKLYISL